MNTTPNNSMPSYNQHAILFRKEGVRKVGICVSKSVGDLDSVVCCSPLNSSTFWNGHSGGQERFFVDHDASA